MAASSVLAFLNVGTTQILFVFLLILLLFGAQKIPEFARALGKAQREFMKARDESTGPSPRESEEQKVRAAAVALGITTEGKTVRELQAEIAKHVSEKPATPTA